MNKKKDSTAKKQSRRWTEIAQLTHDWGSLAAYDDPLHAFCISTITSPVYVGHEKWVEWMHQHYVGDSGYDHRTGQITRPKLREFFDKHYPDFLEQQHKREEWQDKTNE